jgi:uncharacterized protein YdaU (DUF1376 family)
LQYFPFFYNDFKADTNHLTNEEKWIYMSLLIKMYRSGGYVDDLEQLSMTEGIAINDYKNVIVKMFVPSDTKGFYQPRVIRILDGMNKLKQAGHKGGNVTALQNMIKSDDNIDEYKRIWKVYKGTRLHSEKGVEQYCKAKLKDKTGLFNIDNLLNKVKWLNTRFEKDNISIPMMATFFNDSDAKYWKSDDSSNTKPTNSTYANIK